MREGRGGLAGAVVRSTLSIAGGAAVSQVLTGLGFLILARRLPMDLFGRFASMYGISMVLGSLLDFGSSQRVVRELSRSGEQPNSQSWLRRRTTFQAIAILLATLTIVRLWPIPGETAATAVLCLQGLTLSVSQGIGGWVRARRSVALASWQIATGSLLFPLVSLAAPHDIIAVCAAAAATSSWLVTAVVGFRSLIGTPGLTGERFRGNPWKGSYGLGVFSLAAALSALSVPIVAAVAGSEEAASLAAVGKWVQPLILFTIAYSSHSFVTFSSFQGDLEAIRHIRSGTPVLLLGLLGSLTMALLAPSLVDVLLGSNYASSGPLLRLLALSVIPILLGQPIATLLQARGRDRFVGNIGMATTVGALVLTGALGASMGANASPIATSITGVAFLLALVPGAVALYKAPR